MKRCGTYDTADGMDMQKKIGDKRKVYEERTTDKPAGKLPKQREINGQIHPGQEAGLPERLCFIWREGFNGRPDFND